MWRSQKRLSKEKQEPPYYVVKDHYNPRAMKNLKRFYFEIHRIIIIRILF